MKEDNKDSVYFLEQNKSISNSVFNNEVNSYEFVQKIGDMDTTHLKDYKKRDLFLMKLGKKLLMNFKNRKPKTNKNKISIRISHETTVLSQEEISNLLTINYKEKNIFDKFKLKIINIYRKFSEWKIIISKNNIDYKISLNGIEKWDYNKTCSLDIENIIDGVLSQEEIDMLLTPIEKEKK